MPSTPAMTTGMMFLKVRSGRVTPVAESAIPDLPVPYAAPMFEKMSASAGADHAEAGGIDGAELEDVGGHRDDRHLGGGGGPGGLIASRIRLIVG